MNYAEALNRLREAKPDHILLRMLSEESIGNRLVLDAELEKLDAQDVYTSPIGEHPEDSAHEIDSVEDAVLTGLHRQQATLFGERRKLSNSFHACDTDAERREVSEQIQSVQRRIEHVRQQMKDYKAIGHLPAPDEKYPVPEDPFRLLALRASLRSSISRKSREVKELAVGALDNDREASKQLPKAENKLRELQNHLERVEKAIKDRNIQPGGLREG